MPGENLLLRTLSAPLLSLLKPRLRLQQLTTGMVLFAAGDKVSSIYFPQSGAVSLVTDLAGGQMIESAMTGRDGVVGAGAALDDRDAVYKAIVQVAGNGYALDVDFAACGEVVLVLEFGQVAFLPNLPRQKGVACDEGHVVGVHGPEGC